MTCETVRPELDSLVRGELDAAKARLLRAHLAECDACSGALAAVTLLAEKLRALPPEPVDADALADQVLARARRGSSGRRRPASTPSLGFPALALLAVLGAGAGFLAVRALREPTPAGTPGTAASPDTKSPSPEATTPAPSSTPSPAASTPSPEPARTPEPASSPPLTSPDATPSAAPTLSPLGPDAPGPDGSPAPSPDVVAHGPASPTPAPAASAPAPAALAFACASLRGEARVRPAGAGPTGWRPLQPGAALAPGDEVQAVSGSLELSLVRGAAGPTSERVVLAAGARATVAPAAGVGVKLDAGEVFASCAAALSLGAGPSRVSCESGDLSLALGREGQVEVTSWAGRARVEASGTPVDLAPGERVQVEKGGRAGRPAAAPGEAPRWLAAARAIEPARVVWAFRARDALDPLAPPLLVGTRGAEGARGGAVKGKPEGLRAVCLGRGTPEGIAPLETGLRLRVRYRLARTVPLGIQVVDASQGRNYQAVVRDPRPALWSEVDVAVESLAEENKGSHALAAGDRLDLVTISAHGDDPALAFDVAEIVLYRSR